jgi:serine/threonine-protein kinase
VKPQNLLLRHDGVLKLGDFGIALGTENTRLTRTGTVLGTAAYTAPEQARGDAVTTAADIYATGAVLFELLTGRPPSETMARVVPPGPFGHVVLACLARDPRGRPASAAALAHGLAAQDVAPTAVMHHARRRVRPGLALAALAVLAIVGGTSALLATRGGTTTPPARTIVARVAPVPPAATAQQQAQNLAAWLARYSR